MADTQQLNISEQEFLDLLYKAEFYKVLSQEQKERLTLIVFSDDIDAKTDLFNLISNANKDFTNLKSNFLNKQYSNLKEEESLLFAIKMNYDKMKRTNEEKKERQEEESGLDNLLNNL